MHIVSNCKPKEQTLEADPLAGSWVYDSRTASCLKVEGTPYFFRRTQRITRQESWYDYEMFHELFGDAKCSTPLLRNRVSGNYALGDPVEGEKKMRVLFHNRVGMSAIILDRATLDRANLKSSDGLQAGDRLCQMASDWNLYKEVFIKGRKCALGLITQPLERALNAIILSEEGHVIFGENVEGDFPKFPRPLIEVKQEEWYKQNLP